MALLPITVFYAQTSGAVGINQTSPQATLDVQVAAANMAGTTNEGILIPRLTAARVAAMAVPAEGTLVYITDTPSGPKFSATTKGFYYWDATAAKWQKLLGGAAENLYTSNGTLTSSRTVSIPSSLTFYNTNSSANTTFNGGTVMILSGVIKNYREITSSNMSPQITDYTLFKYTSTENLIFTLPGSLGNGRELCFSNIAASGSLTVKGFTNFPDVVLQPGQGRCFQYVASGWVGF